MEAEIWKVYKDTRFNKKGNSNGRGYLWEVSNLGNVKCNGKIVELDTSLRYLSISNFRVHRAIAETFIPNQDNKPCVDHIDGNKHNNRVDNLRWATYKENTNNPNTYSHICGHNMCDYMSEETKRERSRKISEAHKGNKYCKNKHRVYDNEEHTKWHMVDNN